MTVVDGRRYYCSKSAQSNDRAGAIKPLLITAEERGSTSRVTGDIQAAQDQETVPEVPAQQRGSPPTIAAVYD